MTRWTKQISIILACVPVFVFFQNCGGNFNVESLPITVTAASIESNSELEILDFSSNFAEVFIGEKINFKFRVTGAQEVILNPGYINVTGMTSIEIAPAATAQYSLTAKNGSASVSRLLSISVLRAPAIISSFSSNLSSVTSGQSITLTWSVSNASQITVDPGNYNVTNLTSLPLTPNATTVYILKAKNSDGNIVTKSVTVTVNSQPPPAPTITSLTSNFSTITKGENVTLSWVTTSATTLTLNPGNMDVSSKTSVTLAPQSTTTFTLTATNSSGLSANRSIIITVNPSVPLPIISSFVSSSLILYSTETASLSWMVSGATSLKLDPGAIDVMGKSSFTVAPKQNTTYLLTATNAGGSVTKTLSIMYIQPWTISTPLDFIVGEGTSIDLVNTLPAGLVAGGTFAVSPDGLPLPSGMILTANGILSVGTAGAGEADGVIFEYTEP